MKKKNLFVMLFMLATAVFYSCGSDDSSNNNGNNDDNPIVDDNTPGQPHLMEGTWEAEEITLTLGDTSQSMPFDHILIKGGCATDYLTIKASSVAELLENNKNDADDCVDELATGTWSETQVNVKGETREVISVSDTELILEYPYVFQIGGDTYTAKVKYLRQ